MEKDGWRFVGPLALLFLAALWLLARMGFQGWAWAPALVLGLLTAFCANFFRDPDRPLPADQDLLVSPADGRVLEVKDIRDPWVGRAREIRVFLNLFNVHVQRNPFTGEARVGRVDYHPGKFMAASAPKASLENEQNWVCLEGKGGRRVRVKQIAGLIARRIVCRVKPGDLLAGGQRLGLIRFGSQVDLVVPASARVLVKAGDPVTGGLSPLARLAPARSARTRTGRRP